jgi:heme/copper-type cytochrome/quinol oxidase subunit 2
MQVSELFISVMLLGLALTLWLVLALFFFHVAAVDSPPLRRGLVALHHTFAVLPIVWLVAAGLLAVRAYLRLGEWPHEGGLASAAGSLRWQDGNLDPRVFGAHYWLVCTLGATAFIAALLTPPLHLAVRPNLNRPWLWLALYALGIGGSVFAYCNDALAAVAEWV